MALADTAKLITSLELQDKFTKTADKFNRAVGGMERQTSTLSRIGGQVSSGLQNTARNIGRIGLVGAGVLTVAVKNGLEQLQLLESAQAQTNAVLESTQGISGQTAESIRGLAEKYESLNSLIDDKVIQSGENLLLTFTNINKKGFEPALQAALDMNTAMGGGEEGLQGTIIQVGKALQDPIRGLTALRRVGVNFTEQQKKQIKALVEANDLYGAQQIILAELSTEFGGSFAAAGDTAAGKFAKLRDAVEDAQASLATALLPVLTKVADKLGTLLQDPAVIAKIEKFGAGLADGFDKALGFAERLPWDSIGSAFKLMGEGAKVAIDIFSSAPPWLQTAILTGWGLNKLTGGALGNIVGALGSGLIKGVLGMNAGVVNINAGVVNGGGGVGGGVPGAVGGAPLLGLGLLPLLLGGATIALVAAGAAFAISPDRSPDFGSLEGRGGPGRNPRGKDPLSAVETAAAVREGTAPLVSEFQHSRATSAELASLQRSEAARRSLEAARTLDQLRSQTIGINQIAAKPASTVVNVAVNAKFSVTQALNKITISNSIRYDGKTVPL